ncbi:unnamed protein product [marine sediment metagenome]|uniref:VRR-NUC domain-containing protein n=1 Tax=marine sediment metagenome TaxID=412755 RepID=X1A0X4_9ZZZZ
MTERQLLTALTRHIRQTFKQNVFWYKIPDSPMVTTPKPFDVFCIYDSFSFAFEFKKPANPVTPKQYENLMSFAHSGGLSYVATFQAIDEEHKTERNIIFKDLALDKEVTLLYKNGEYIDLINLFEQLLP